VYVFTTIDNRRLRHRGLVLAILAGITALGGRATAEPSDEVRSDGRAKLRVTFNGTESDFTYRVTTVHQGTPLAACPGNCKIKLSPGDYFLEVEPAAGSGWRSMEEPLSVRTDSVVEAKPGRISPHGWGLGLAVFGTIALVGGAVGFTATHLPAAKQNDVLSLTSIGLLGAAGLSLGAGIYLLATSSNGLDVRPMHRAAVNWPFRTVALGAQF
jgi:hypothetical protein